MRWRVNEDARWIGCADGEAARLIDVSATQDVDRPDTSCLATETAAVRHMCVCACGRRHKRHFNQIRRPSHRLDWTETTVIFTELEASHSGCLSRKFWSTRVRISNRREEEKRGYRS